MKAKLLQQNLKTGLATVNRAIASRYTLPVLGNVLFWASEEEGGYLALSGTDLELRIDCRVPAAVEQAGAITVPARLLSDFVGALPGERIDLEADQDTLYLHCGKHSATIKGISANEFPTPNVPDIPLGTISGETLATMIRNVIFATADDQSRIVLTGVFLSADPSSGEITMVSADGFRLAVCRHISGDALAKEIAVLVPGRALGEIARPLDVEPVALYVDDEKRSIRCAIPGDPAGVSAIAITSQLIEGSFINYQQIVPTTAATTLRIDTQALIRTCKTASIFARSEANAITLDVGDSAGSQAITVEATSVEVGDYGAELPAEIEGEPVRIAINVGFLLDALGTIDTARTTVQLNSADRPLKITPEDSDDLVHVIMPMHIRD